MSSRIVQHRLYLVVSALGVVAASAHAQTVLGGSLVVQSNQDILATYLGNSATYDNDLYLFSPTNSLGIIFRNHADPVGAMRNLGSFPIGTALTFRLHVNNTGDDFFSGPASLNPDNQFHTRVTYNSGAPDTTLVEFEDLFNGPFNYNDLSFSFTNTPTPGSASTVVLAGVLMARRRRR